MNIIIEDEQKISHPLSIDVPENLDTREGKIRQYFNKRSKIIEIGASHAPIVPKADGWNTTVVDHTSRDILIKKYQNETNLINRVEEVDYIWQSGDITDAIPKHLHGTFDGIIASHVGEHFPDFLRFLQSCGVLLNEKGIISLALPDKRVCFDILQSLSNTGDILAAYSQKRIRHERKTFFNQTAYMVSSNDTIGWAIGSKLNLKLLHSLDSAIKAFNDADTSDDSEYVDSHAWYFTPNSLKLIILELRYLGLIPFGIEIERAAGVEFYVKLFRQELDKSLNINAVRLELLKEIVLERKEEIDSISDSLTDEKSEKINESSSRSSREKNIKKITRTSSENFSEKFQIEDSKEQELTISAVIPVYNGSKYIIEAIKSVLDQTLPVKELIIIDDGSSDNSREKIEEFIAKTSAENIHLFSQENSGQSSARNFGVSKSTGNLIALLDQDDMWAKNHLEELIKPFLEDKAKMIGWVYSNLDEVDEKGQMVTRSFLSTMGTTHPKEDIFSCIREDLFILPSAALIRREAFDQVGGFDVELSGYEDDDLFRRIFQAGYHNVYLNKPLSKWRIHPESASYSFRMARSRNIYMRKLIAEFPDDVKRSRYYRRDLIVPRFYPHLMSDFIMAVRDHNEEQMKVVTDQLNFLSEFVGNRRKKLKIKAITAILDRPKVAKFAYSIRKPFRKSLLNTLNR